MLEGAIPAAILAAAPITRSMSSLLLRKIGLQSTLFVALATCSCGCTSVSEYVHNGFKVGPNYSTPEAAVASNWIDASDKRVRSDADDLSKWWTVFNDPVLDDLICDAYHQNLTLKEAGYRVLQSRGLSLASPSANSSRKRRR